MTDQLAETRINKVTDGGIAKLIELSSPSKGREDVISGAAKVIGLANRSFGEGGVGALLGYTLAGLNGRQLNVTWQTVFQNYIDKGVSDFIGFTAGLLHAARVNGAGLSNLPNLLAPARERNEASMTAYGRRVRTIAHNFLINDSKESAEGLLAASLSNIEPEEDFLQRAFIRGLTEEREEQGFSPLFQDHRMEFLSFLGRTTRVRIDEMLAADSPNDSGAKRMLRNLFTQLSEDPPLIIEGEEPFSSLEYFVSSFLTPEELEAIFAYEDGGSEAPLARATTLAGEILIDICDAESDN